MCVCVRLAQEESTASSLCSKPIKKDRSVASRTSCKVFEKEKSTYVRMCVFVYLLIKCRYSLIFMIYFFTYLSIHAFTYVQFMWVLRTGVDLLSETYICQVAGVYKPMFACLSTTETAQTNLIPSYHALSAHLSHVLSSQRVDI